METLPCNLCYPPGTILSPEEYAEYEKQIPKTKLIKGDLAANQRCNILEQQRAVLKDYLQVKMDEEDYHGVADAAMDIRDIDSELKGLRFSK